MRSIIGESKSINGSKFWESENRIIGKGLSIIYQGLVNGTNIVIIIM